MNDLSGKLTPRDLTHPEVIEGLVRDATIQAFGKPGDVADLSLERRGECSKRGYHQVSKEPKKDEDLMICYDCEVWTSRGFLREIGMRYRVNPL